MREACNVLSPFLHHALHSSRCGGSLSLTPHPPSCTVRSALFLFPSHFSLESLIHIKAGSCSEATVQQPSHSNAAVQSGHQAHPTPAACSLFHCGPHPLLQPTMLHMKHLLGGLLATARLFFCGFGAWVGFTAHDHRAGKGLAKHVSTQQHACRCKPSRPKPAGMGSATLAGAEEQAGAQRCCSTQPNVGGDIAGVVGGAGREQQTGKGRSEEQGIASGSQN